MFDKIKPHDDLVHYENERCSTGETQTQKCYYSVLTTGILTLCDTCNNIIWPQKKIYIYPFRMIITFLIQSVKLQLNIYIWINIRKYL